jgi:hypothetical protein
MAEWPAGRLVSQHSVLSIPADVTPGRADLTLTVVGHDGQPWKFNKSQHLTLGSVVIEERPVMRQLPDGVMPIQVHFSDQVGGTGDEIVLRGYRTAGEAQPGGRLVLDYAWQAQTQPTRIYSVFNHLFSADGRRISQADGWPQGGLVLTTQWLPGEYVRDSHTLEIPADAPPGPYLLVVGLYDAATGERLHAFVDEQPLPNNQWPLPIGDE